MNHNMFLYRLKTELTENIRLLAFYLICLAIIFSGNLFWWLDSGKIGHDNPGYHGDTISFVTWLAILGVGSAAFILITNMFKRDDLKNPQDFCATRPIRALPFYGAKLAFTWLGILFPAGVVMVTMGLITRSGVGAIIAGGEVLILIGFPCSLLAFCCMSHAGIIQPMRMVGSFILGAFFIWVLLFALDSMALFGETRLGSNFISYNILIFFALLTLGFTWMCIHQARNKHLHIRPMWLSLTGAMSMLCITFAPIPPTRHFQPETIHAPAVTRASNMGTHVLVGEKSGIPCIRGQFLTEPIEELNDMNISLVHQPILMKAEGVDAPWFEVRYDHHTSDGIGINSATKLRFSYTVFKTEPGRIAGKEAYSTGSLELQKAVKNLPTRKVRIKGTVTIPCRGYTEFHRSHLNEGFSIGVDGQRITHIPSGSDAQEGGDIIATKQLSTRLMNPADIFSRGVFRHYITHPSLEQPIFIDEFAGNSSGTEALFTQSITKHYDLSPKGLRFSPKWEELVKEQADQNNPEKLRKEATLVTEKLGDLMKVEIPVDIEIEIPDPELMRKMLIEEKY